MSINYNDIFSFLAKADESVEDTKEKIQKIRKILYILNHIEKYGINNLTITIDYCEDHDLFDYLGNEKNTIINYLKILLEYKLHELKEEVNGCIYDNKDLLQRLKDMEQEEYNFQ